MPAEFPHLDPPTLLFRNGSLLPDETSSPAVAQLAVAEPDVVSVTGCLHRQRLTAVLRGLCEGFDASGAELLLLDDATTTLRPEAAFGDGVSAGPRPLQGARADLSALAGGAVVLEDQDSLAEWGVPRGCRAAVCLPVSSDETIHGTLWLYCKQPRTFTDAEVQLIEIAAGRLAVEHERRRLLDATAAANPPQTATDSPDPAVGSTLANQPAVLPSPTTPIELGEIEAAGWSDTTQIGMHFHDWLVLPDGRLLVAAGAVVEMPGGDAAGGLLAAQAARVALRCHAEALAVESDERSMDAGQLLTRVSRSVWQATPGGEGLSIAAALLDPEECRGAFALAGGAVALAIRASRTTTKATENPPVGWDPCPGGNGYASHPFKLALRERLVLTAVDPRMTNPRQVEALANRYRGLAPETHRRMTAAAAASALADLPNPPLAAAAIRWA